MVNLRRVSEAILPPAGSRPRRAQTWWPRRSWGFSSCPCQTPPGSGWRRCHSERHLQFPVFNELDSHSQLDRWTFNTLGYHIILIFFSFYSLSVASITSTGIIYPIMSCKSVTPMKLMVLLLPIYLFSKIFLLAPLSLLEIQLFPGLSSLDPLHSVFLDWMFMFAAVNYFNVNKLISTKHIRDVMCTVQL